MKKIRALRWDTGSVIPPHLARSLSNKETEFFSNYDRLLNNYMMDFDLDLTADQQPPKDLCIEVRVLEDCGELVTENGTVNLEAHTTHYLPRSDVEHLVRQGKLQHLDNES